MPLQGLTNPIRVEVKHPFLILQNMKQRDSIFHIYDLTSHTLKCAFGIMGEGPKDLVAPWLFQTQFSDFLISDLGKNFIYRFEIDEEGQPVLKSTKQPGYIEGVNEAAFINDSLFVVDARYTAPSLYLFALQDELPKKTWKYRNPDMVDYIADPNMGSVYANENRIVFCYGYKKQIDFMDIDFNLIKRVKFKFANPTIINSKNQGDVKISYVYSYLGKRYLYALFFGTSWNENRANSTRGTFLEVFDLDGNPIVRYHLEGRRPVYFAVDEETFTLYGAGEDGDPEDNLLVYKLKGLS
ncbi:TolB-like 6-bladed beta-propeller domain-containing protein [Parabacteroides pacaensis]|uniref:TolB-like 6-bladed beta-propeller domain-containing protein n=1 Tax=Parabacteroides pacaensis TaxID=2086575 RepID=UPI0021D35CD3|nr:TolB-like 6-bladed beta-propeller domain-containing protein [Parabacteroides pacaensis]